MTAICPGGGPSQPIGSFPLFVYMSGAALGAFLLNKIAPSWAPALEAGVAGTTYELANLCNTDPPADPGINATDVAALLLRGDPVATVAAQNKVDQLIQRYIWYSFCECAPGPTPGVPGPLSPPSGLPVIDPPSVAVRNPMIPVVCQSQGIPGQSTQTTAGGNTIARFGAIPANGTALQVWAGYTHTGVGPHQTTSIQLVWRNVGGTILATRSYDLVADGVTRPFTFAIEPTGTDVIINITYAAVSTDQFECYAFVLCNGAPGASSGCCPPDPALQREIDEILRTVTLLQRQIAPFAYVPGNVHTGLSGAGTIAIQGLLGLKIEVTSIPGSYGRTGSDPEVFFDMGFVTLGTSDGYDQSTRVNRQSQILLPPRCSAYTDFGYELRPGVVVTVTELVREQ